MNRRGRRAIAWTTASAAAAVAAGVVVTTPAQAAASFTGVAAAYGIDSTTSNPSIPLGLVVQAAGPAAQATLSSLHQSDTFASVPYPGEGVAGLPGVVGGSSGVPLPEYPFIVTTSLGEPPAHATYGAATLSGESAVVEARATAETGDASSGYTATARVTHSSDDSVLAMAEARLSALTISGVVALDGVHAVARVERAPDGRLIRTASTSIASLVVPGLELTFPPQLPPPLGGLRLEAPRLSFSDGRFRVFLPGLGEQSQPVPANTVLQALKAVGITATYEQATQVPNGILAPTLTLRTRLPSPPPNQVVNGATDISVTIGRALATISYTVEPATTGTPSAPVDRPGASGPTLDDGPAMAPGLDTPAATTADASAAPPVSPLLAAPQAPAVTRSGLVPLTRLPDLYLVLVLASFAVFGAGQALRLLAVRSA